VPAICPGEKPGSVLIRRSAAMLWYSSVKWKYELLAGKRGLLRPRPDRHQLRRYLRPLLPLSQSTLEDHIIVYPKIFPVGHLVHSFSKPMGESRSEYRVFQDPTRTIECATRTETASGTITGRQAHAFKALQVKVLKPTTAFKVAVFLSVDSFTRNGSSNEDEFETRYQCSRFLGSSCHRGRKPRGSFCEILKRWIQVRR